MGGAGTSSFGNKYWFVLLASGDGVHFHADDLSVTDAGTLVGTSQNEGSTVVMFTAGPGKWDHAYAAGMIDGRPVAVEFWEKKGSKSEKKKGKK
jgi:hypothetical protein